MPDCLAVHLGIRLTARRIPKRLGAASPARSVQGRFRVVTFGGTILARIYKNILEFHRAVKAYFQHRSEIQSPATDLVADASEV